MLKPFWGVAWELPPGGLDRILPLKYAEMTYLKPFAHMTTYRESFSRPGHGLGTYWKLSYAETFLVYL